MSDRKRPGHAPQVNTIRTSLVDSGWEEQPTGRVPEYSGTAHSLPRTEHQMDSITQEVDDLLEVDEEPSAPQPPRQPSVGARPVLAIGVRGQPAHSLGDDELEAALSGKAGAVPPPGASRAAQPQRGGAAALAAAPLPRFASDDSQPGYRAGAALPGFDDDLFDSLSKPSTRPPRGVVHAPPHVPPKSTPPPKPSAAPLQRPPSSAPPRPPSARPPAVGTFPPQGMTAPPANLSLPDPFQLEPVMPFAAPLATSAPEDATMVTRAPRPGVPAWAAGALAVITLGIGVAGGVFAAGSSRASDSAPVPSATAPEKAPAPDPVASAVQAKEPEKPAESEPAPVAPEDLPKASGSLLEQASSGDDAALAKLTQRAPAQRTRAEALAIAAGQSALRLRAARELRSKLAKDPKLASDPEVAKALREHAVDVETQREALAAMAELPDSRGPDLLYEVWTRTPRRTPATELAEALLRSKEVRPKASKQLNLLIELRDAEKCEAVPALLARATADADRRALAPMMRFLSKRGCGPTKNADCFPCLGKRDTVRDAIKAARDRKEPKL